MAAGAARFESMARLLTEMRHKGRSSLTEPETMAILALAGVSVPRERIVSSAREAASVARQVGFPVVLKIVSPDLPHKSDTGGVRLGLDSVDAVQKASLVPELRVD